MKKFFEFSATAILYKRTDVPVARDLKHSLLHQNIAQNGGHPTTKRYHSQFIISFGPKGILYT